MEDSIKPRDHGGAEDLAKHEQGEPGGDMPTSEQPQGAELERKQQGRRGEKDQHSCPGGQSHQPCLDKRDRRPSGKGRCSEVEIVDKRLLEEDDGCREGHQQHFERALETAFHRWAINMPMLAFRWSRGYGDESAVGAVSLASFVDGAREEPESPRLKRRRLRAGRPASGGPSPLKMAIPA